MYFKQKCVSIVLDKNITMISDKKIIIGEERKQERKKQKLLICLSLAISIKAGKWIKLSE